MPGFNQKGPRGEGAMTGRRMGRCTNFGANQPKPLTNTEEKTEENSEEILPEINAGNGRGLGRGKGVGRGQGGQGRGLGRQNRFRGGNV